MTQELPPLPKADMLSFTMGDMYSGDKMRDYADAALAQQAARHAEDLAAYELTVSNLRSKRVPGPDNASWSYEMIDRFLRNNLHDDDYAEYLDALNNIAATAPEPERKPAPMHEGEIQAAWIGQDLDELIPYTFVLGIRSAERFNGILPAPEDKP